MHLNAYSASSVGFVHLNLLHETASSCCCLSCTSTVCLKWYEIRLDKAQNAGCVRRSSGRCTELLTWASPCLKYAIADSGEWCSGMCVPMEGCSSTLLYC